MSRVVALAVLLAVIVASGFWLARDRSAGQSTAPTVVQTANTTPPAPATEAEPPAATEPADADEPASSDEEPTAAQDGTPVDEQGTEASEAQGAKLPDGYTQVPYLTETPVQAFDTPQQVIDPDLDYVAVLRTNRGDMTVELYADATPVTVNNFVFLALNHYYDGVPFHRVLEGFMAQTGDPTGTGRGGPGYQFDDEIVADLSFDSRGILAMANAGKAADGSGTNGSQFFITFEPTQWLDGKHTIFGRVIAGEEVLDAITRVDPGTPSAIAFYDDTLASLRSQGVDLPGADDVTVADAIEALLGTLPLPGQSFNVAGYVGAAGQAGGQSAFGFFPNPDQLDTVVIAARPRN